VDPEDGAVSSWLPLVVERHPERQREIGVMVATPEERANCGYRESSSVNARFAIFSELE
jgi:hypothetical protein